MYQIGKSELCAHVVAVLYNLRHRTEHGEFMLSLTLIHKTKCHRQAKICSYESTNIVF